MYSLVTQEKGTSATTYKRGIPFPGGALLFKSYATEGGRKGGNENGDFPSFRNQKTNRFCSLSLLICTRRHTQAHKYIECVVAQVSKAVRYTIRQKEV